MKHLLLLFIILVLAQGCKTNSTEVASYNGPLGTLKGKIASLTDYRGREVADKSGIVVQCRGTAYTAITDSGGNWTISDLPTSTYCITATKDGFNPFMLSSFQFIGGGIERVWYMALSQTCRFTVILDSVTLPLPDSILVIDSSRSFHRERPGSSWAHSLQAPDSIVLYAQFIFGRTTKLDPADTSTFALSFDAQTTINGAIDGPATFTSELSFRAFDVFHSGETVYVQAFPYIKITQTYDIATDKTTSYGYGEGSNILSYVMP